MLKHVDKVNFTILTECLNLISYLDDEQSESIYGDIAMLRNEARFHPCIDYRCDLLEICDKYRGSEAVKRISDKYFFTEKI